MIHPFYGVWPDMYTDVRELSDENPNVLRVKCNVHFGAAEFYRVSKLALALSLLSEILILYDKRTESISKSTSRRKIDTAICF